MSKQVNARIRNKVDSTERWNNSLFTSLKGELYIHRDNDICQLKVGDDELPVSELPFVKFQDGSDTSIELEPVPKPTLKQLYFDYNGAIHTVELTSTAGFSYTGATQAINPGTYSITCTLDSGYCWNDGTTYEITLTWRVNKLAAYIQFEDIDNSIINLTSKQSYFEIRDVSGPIINVYTNSENITARIETEEIVQETITVKRYLVITVDNNSNRNKSCQLTIEVDESRLSLYEAGVLTFEINPSGIIYNDLESNTWETIATAIHKGDRRWNVGDTKKVYLHGGNNRVSFGTSTEATVRLLGYNKDADGNYNGTADFEFVEAIVESGYNKPAYDTHAFTLHNHNGAGGNVISSKNFNDTPVYDFLNNYFINYVEKELLNVILPITRKMTTLYIDTTDSSTKTSYNTLDTEDTNYKFTIIAPEETCFAGNYENTKDYYTVYDYYANANTDSLYKYNIFNKNEQCYCWTRYYICERKTQNSDVGDLVRHYGVVYPELKTTEQKYPGAGISFGIAPIFTVGLNSNIQ